LCAALAALAGCCSDECYETSSQEMYGNPFASQYSGVDYPCYGYHPTCWRAWPSDCPNCPPEHAAPLPKQAPPIPDPPHESIPAPESPPSETPLPKREYKGIQPPVPKKAEEPAVPDPPAKPEKQTDEDPAKSTGRF